VDSPRAAYLAGLRYTASLSAPYLVFGTVCGVAAKQAGADALQAALLPALIFGGSAQIVLASLLIAGAPLLVVIASAVMVNSRMAIYSALVSQWLREHKQSQRTAVASLLVDQTYAAALDFRRRHSDSPFWFHYYISVGVWLWAWWLCANMIGYFAGTFVPSSWQLEFAVPLSFVAILAPLVKRLPMALAAIVGATLGILLFALPFKLGLIAACMIGVSVMLALEARFEWKT
jgi:4-azaleucine resistance transporter AzlC